jgi:queuine tRNA-ribosyltransferase
MNNMFEILSTKGKARRGKLVLDHGVIETPFFMPIATKGAVKTLSSLDMAEIGAQILLSNTYHLLLRPGKEEMKKHGGLHKFMNWDKPILTDSGGYQVFSLSRMNRIEEDGVTFNSHIDGMKIKLTPEGSMDMQSAIGADMIMQFDDVAAGDSSKDRFEDAMERSLRWAKRCKDSYDKTQKLFGIVQGGIHADLRERSAKGLVEIGFDGYAIGGLSVGESKEDCFKFAELTAGFLPEDKVRYFMGGGMPEDIVHYVNAGIDMFDCVIPTRNARHGTLFTWNQNPDDIDFVPAPKDFYTILNVQNQKQEFDEGPIDEHCDCEACANFSRAYIRHLFRVNEMLAFRLCTIHNLAFYMKLMKRIRESI